MYRWSMNAIGREHLQYNQTELPQPGPGQVRVKVGAVSLNFRDKLMIDNGMGLPLQFPFIPASDMAGAVDALGPGVSRFAVGARVISTFAPGWIDGKPGGTGRDPLYHSLGGREQGVLAEYVVLDENWLAAAPASLNDAEASTLPCAGLTAWFALVELGRLQQGESVLVQGTGGVALLGLQIAHALGAKVLVTSGDADKLQRALALGATHGIHRKQIDWATAALELTEDRGIDHILDTVGGGNLAQSLRAVAVAGRISLIGVLDGFEVSGPSGPFLLKQVTVQGITVGHRRALEDLVRFVDAHQIKPVIDQQYRFADLPKALAHLDRGAFGKIVLTP
ncbi:zinc-dependent alcohol dehydrogenase family protein [Amantichitinum ursilacus]|uniref:Phthiocerol synthesis polyketide synthase type I PpsC n=1 Tax=Amantichitinum ursilacus TaxID=857265 RepID=A0A0N0GNX1_9NEIS|nr:NAD(P)-dependent alcohol dehydrogenase [Amantichitinum ursilacus]KPC53245.1 Phthiocerol synthesis polyketide synthase type I PpsC [Amantichitinum ursilacus]